MALPEPFYGLFLLDLKNSKSKIEWEREREKMKGRKREGERKKERGGEREIKTEWEQLKVGELMDQVCFTGVQLI